MHMTNGTDGGVTSCTAPRVRVTAVRSTEHAEYRSTAPGGEQKCDRDRRHLAVDARGDDSSVAYAGEAGRYVLVGERWRRRRWTSWRRPTVSLVR